VDRIHPLSGQTAPDITTRLRVAIIYLTVYLTIWLSIFVRTQDHELNRLFQALSDTTRRGILMRIREGDRTVNDIASQFDISLPAVSKHLSILERAGLLTRRKEGRKRICHVEPKQLQNATEWLEFYQSFWSERLENLRKIIESDTDDATHRRKK